MQELIRAIAENHTDVELLISFNAAMTSEAIARAILSNAGSSREIFMCGKVSATAVRRL